VGGLGLAVFEQALKVLEECPANCDRSCYRCLRSYKNKFEHDLLDRHVGASLLRFALTSAPPKLNEARISRSTDLLFQDLERQGLEGVQLKRSTRVAAPGLGNVVAPILATNKAGGQYVIGLHGPLTPDDPPDDSLQQLKEYSTAMTVILVDELVVRRNLPRATSDLIRQIEPSA
jgi:hypothetical protein